MRLRARVAAVVALLLLASGCAAAGVDDDMPGAPDDDLTAPRSGGTLPDLTLQAFDGPGSLELRELRGPAVVNLWASWCTPCRRELPHYQAFSEQYAGRVDVIGIDFQETSRAAARELLRRTGVSYPVYSDPDGGLRAIGLPKVVMIDAEGQIAFEQYLEIDSPEQLAELAEEHLGVAP